MSFAKLATEGPTSQRQFPPCAITLLLWDLPDAEAEGLRQMLDSPDWTHAQVTVALDDEGYDHIQQNTVSRHRRGICCKGHR